MKNLLLLVLVLILSIENLELSAQSGTIKEIKGIVLDEAGYPLIFANVIAGDRSVGISTDLDGRFYLTLNDSCNYLEVFYTGYKAQKVDITGKDSVTIVLNFEVQLSSVTVTGYKVPLIEQDNSTQGGLVTGEQRRNRPVKNINAIAATTAGVSSSDQMNVRGSRNNATNYYIDGIQNVNGVNVPSQHQAQSQLPWNSNTSNPDKSYHTEDYSLIVENKFHTPVDAPLSTFSIDVDRASYSNMRRFLENGSRPPKDAIRLEELVNYFDYDYPQPDGDVPFAVITEVSECPWNKEHKLVHIGLQGKTIPTKDLPASNLVFLIDVSGSMDNDNKLPLVISSFKLLTEHLRENDRVAIVVYAGSSGLVLPSTPGTEKEKIDLALSRLRAGGSTAGAAGIRQAYKIARENFIEGGNNRVILATDGDFNVGVSSDAELIQMIEEERKSGVFLSVLGYGVGNYMDNKMQQLADHGNGNHAYVDNIDEARKVFVHEFGGTLFTIAKDVKIQVEFNPAEVAAYRLVGYENRLLQDEDFNDDRKDAGEIGSGHTVTALYEIIPVGKKSDLIRSVDELKYQSNTISDTSRYSSELMTVKIRYKKPDGDISSKIDHVVFNDGIDFTQSSENFRWSAAVATFGMLLRDSEFIKDASFTDVELWAENSKGNDKLGYRKEFLKLVRGVDNIPEGTAEK